MNYNKFKKISKNIPRLLLTFKDNLSVEMGRSLPKRGPLVVVWDINRKCDARCICCNYWKEGFSGASGELVRKEKMKIIQKLSKAKVYLLSFSKGEPLLSEDLLDLIIEAKKEGLLVNISTNGSLLEEKAAKLIESGVDFITISIESHISEVHDKIRGYKGLFDKIERGIEAIKRIGRKNRPYIIVRKLVDRKTFLFLEDYVSYWEDKVDEIELKPITENPKAFYKVPEDMRFRKEDEADVIKCFSVLLKKHRVLNSNYNREIPAHLFQKKSLNKEYRCFAGTFFGNIDCEGNIYPCIEGTDRMGNLNKEEFMKIWASPAMNVFRSNFKDSRNCNCWSDRFLFNIAIQKIANLIKMRFV